MSRAQLLESQQSKLIYRGADRSRRDWIGEGIFYEYDKTWPVAAETRTEFEVETLTYAGYTELCCSTFYSFVPRAGRAYVVTPGSVVKDWSGRVLTEFEPSRPVATAWLSRPPAASG